MKWKFSKGQRACVPGTDLYGIHSPLFIPLLRYDERHIWNADVAYQIRHSGTKAQWGIPGQNPSPVLDLDPWGQKMAPVRVMRSTYRPTEWFIARKSFKGKGGEGRRVGKEEEGVGRNWAIPLKKPFRRLSLGFPLCKIWTVDIMEVETWKECYSAKLNKP